MNRPATPAFKTKGEYLGFLKGLAQRIEMVHGESAAPISSSIASMVTAVESDGFDDLSKAYGQRVQAMHDGDVEARAEVTRMRVTRINNFVIALSKWLSFFQPITLADDEIPYFQLESFGETLVNVSTSTDGGMRKGLVAKYLEPVQLGLFFINSELIPYTVWDPLRGNVADEIKSLVDIARDLEEKISQRAKTFLDTAIIASPSTFTTTGPKQRRTYNAHSAIQTDNFPVRNTIVETTGSRFGKAQMDAVLQYGAQWGEIFGAPLIPKSVMIPSKDATGHLADVQWTSQPNQITQQIYSMGRVENYGGTAWNLLPDVTLSSTSGYAYVNFGRPVGQFFTKPGGDKSIDREVDGPLGNMNEMGARKLIGFAVPKQWNPFILRVKFK